ncbi:methyltransferase domain-containing protein [Candidatus Uhrbacteria bacterium]|nr:methyltransferase domain-containing protein [Candidatus Uhrbacteria bacterium]MBD3284643.1 methyltransferase domain-containing protein [Candidatus Uhrbacteria bacterium]
MSDQKQDDAPQPIGELTEPFIAQVLLHRLRRERGTVNPQTEARDREVRATAEASALERYKRLALPDDVHPAFMESIFYAIHREADRQRMLPGRTNPGPVHPNMQDSEEDVRYKLRANLKALTRLIAKTYDAQYGKNATATQMIMEFEANRIRELTARAFRTAPGGSACDLGCATGRLTRNLCEQFRDVIGVDISPEMIEQAKRLTSERDIRPRFVVQDLDEGLDQPEDSASLIVMSMGTASDICEIKRLLQSIHRVLKKGGRFFLSFQNADALLYDAQLPWRPPLEASYSERYNYLVVRDHAIHTRRYRQQEIETFIQAAGLTPDRWDSFPTIASILPNEALAGDMLREAIFRADEHLSQEMRGIYTCVSGHK